jgi:hypothetical protein
MTTTRRPPYAHTRRGAGRRGVTRFSARTLYSPLTAPMPRTPATRRSMRTSASWGFRPVMAAMLLAKMTELAEHFERQAIVINSS